MNKAAGALVSDVTPDSPGAKAGLKTGDVVTELDGKPITDAGELKCWSDRNSLGDTVHLQVMRDDKSTTVDVTLADLNGGRESETAGKEHGKGRWGITLGELTPELRGQLQASASIHGALVNDVVPGSPADNAGISRGDIIMEVDRKPMKSVSEVGEALTAIPAGQDALVLVWSNGGTTFRVLRSSEQ